MTDYGKLGKLMGVASNGGAFLTAGDKPNVMTIGWCLQGMVWNRDVLMVPVRFSRFTHTLMGGDFTVLFPDTPMKEQLTLCGTKSGRDMDKVAACGFDMKRSQAVDSWYIDAPGTVLHCRTLYKTDMDAAALDPDVDAKMYADGDYHTLYFAEILAVTKR